MRLIFAALFLSFFFFSCSSKTTEEPQNQGSVIQREDGSMQVQLTSRHFSPLPRLDKTSVFVAYAYKENNYSSECLSEPAGTQRERCEDRLIFLNDQIDAIAFTNEPGYFGYDDDYDTYAPSLQSDQTGANYPSSMPKDPEGTSDEDLWQCYQSYWENNNYVCGINPHPIRFLDTSLTTHHMEVYAADGSGYPGEYLGEYNGFQSLNHPVTDGERFYMYIGVHFGALRGENQSENRFLPTSSVFTRPAAPDLISRRIPITVRLIAEGPHDAPGSMYPIPDISTWESPACTADTASSLTAGQVVISEVLWMGSIQTDLTDHTADEFLELYNNGSTAVSVGGWKIQDAGTSGADLVLPACTKIQPGKTFVIANETGKLLNKADWVTSSVALSNSGTNLNIVDAENKDVFSMTSCTDWGGKGENASSNIKASMILPKSAMTGKSIACAVYATTDPTNPTQTYSTDSMNADYIHADGTSGTLANPGMVE